jgi:hypothetical protein
MVNAIGGMQQSVLSYGQALGQQNIARSQGAIRASYIKIIQSMPENSQRLYQKVITKSFTFGETISAYSGDVIMYSERGYFAECIIANSDFEKKELGVWYIYKDGQPACKASENAMAYDPLYLNVLDGARNEVGVLWPLTVKIVGQKINLCMRSLGMNFACIKGLSSDRVTHAMGFVGERKSLTPLVRFDGVKNGLLRFSYTPPNAAPGALAVEVSANPVESRDVTVGDINFEILEWSDTAIAVKMK